MSRAGSRGGAGVGTELARWRSRGVVLAMVLVAIAFAVLAAGAAVWESRPLSSAERGDAAAQAALASRDPDVRREVDDCTADPSAYVGSGATADDCRATLLPSAERYLPREPLDLAAVVTQRGADVTLVVVGLMVIAGCAFAGGDWASRSMATQLTLQPRRRRLWTAKALAVAIGTGVAAAVALLAFWGLLGTVALVRGLDPGPGALLAALEQVGRGTALAAAAALGGFALTMVFRHTVATLALLFVYAVGGEVVLGLLPVEGAERWSVGRNALAWIEPARIVADPSSYWSASWQSGAFLAALTAVAALVSVAVFARRDA